VIVAGYSDRGELTPRMRDVLAGAARGETAAETARRLAVSPHTVNVIRAAARARLGASSTSKAAALAKGGGLID